MSTSQKTINNLISAVGKSIEQLQILTEDPNSEQSLKESLVNLYALQRKFEYIIELIENIETY